jgi:hypothetical protein
MVWSRAVLVAVAAALCACRQNPAAEQFTELYVHDGATPVADAQLTLHPDDLSKLSHDECQTYTTDKNGKARVDHLDPGAYSLAVYHPIYVFYQKLVTIKGNDRLDCALTEGAYVDGVVVDSRDRPVADTMVRAIDPMALQEFRSAKSDASGQFHLTGLPIQPIRLYAHSGRHRPCTNDELSFAKPAEHKTVRLTLADGKMLTGKVVDKDGKPVEGATVGCSDEGALFWQTGTDGTFVLGGLGDDPVNAYAYKVGLAPHHIRSLLPGTKEITFVLKPPATITGQIEFPRGVEELTVSVVKDNLKIATVIVHPEHPKFEFKDLSADRYVLVAEGASALRMEISVAEGETRDLGLVRLPESNLFQEGPKR